MCTRVADGAQSSRRGWGFLTVRFPCAPCSRQGPARAHTCPRGWVKGRLSRWEGEDQALRASGGRCCSRPRHPRALCQASQPPEAAQGPRSEAGIPSRPLQPPHGQGALPGPLLRAALRPPLGPSRPPGPSVPPEAWATPHWALLPDLWPLRSLLSMASSSSGTWLGPRDYDTRAGNLRGPWAGGVTPTALRFHPQGQKCHESGTQLDLETV